MDAKVYQGMKILTGTCTWKEWQKQTRWKFKNQGRVVSQTQEEFVGLKEIIIDENISFVFFNGSWCPDSMQEMPQLYELFEAASITDDRIQLIGLDMDKRDLEGFSEKYSVEYIPTLVILKDKKEIGRIVEHPEGGWERSLLNRLTDFCRH